MEATTEQQSVEQWRFEELQRAGYPDQLAQTLAENQDVDLHQAVEIVAAGCDPSLAVRILV